MSFGQSFSSLSKDSTGTASARSQAASIQRGGSHPQNQGERTSDIPQTHAPAASPVDRVSAALSSHIEGRAHYPARGINFTRTALVVPLFLPVAGATPSAFGPGAFCAKTRMRT